MIAINIIFQKVAELWVPLCYYASALYLAVIFGGQVNSVEYKRQICMNLNIKGVIISNEI